MNDQPDPIAEAFRTYKKRPKDVVPKAPLTEEDSHIPTGPGQPYHVDEYIEGQGMTREAGYVFVGTSIYSLEQLKGHRRQMDGDNG